MISVILLIFGTFISTANAAQMAMGGGYWIHNLNGPKPSDTFLGELAKGLPIIVKKCQPLVPEGFECPSGQTPSIYPRRACYNLKAGQNWPAPTKINNACDGMKEVIYRIGPNFQNHEIREIK